MGRRRRRPPERPGPAGFLVIDKGPGQTSHDVVEAVRRILGTHRVGHLGTLDPQATGVLPVAVREATKLVPFLPAMSKRYVGTVRLGVESDTLDADGEILRRHEGPLPDEARVRKALSAFLGEIDQIPPMYSAVKKDGVPLHRLARRGEEVEREPKRVTIERLELLRFELPDVELEVVCSAGTYVRTLAADLGAALGCGALLQSLRRLESGPFTIDAAIGLEALAERVEADPEAGLEGCLLAPEIPLDAAVVQVNEASAQRVRHGADCSPGAGLRRAPGARVIVRDPEGGLLALMELRADRRLWPLRVFQGV